MLVGCDTAPTMKNVAGEYKLKVDEHSFKAVLLDIGTIEIYYDGKPLGGGGTPWWCLSNTSYTQPNTVKHSQTCCDFCCDFAHLEVRENTKALLFKA